MPVGPASSPSGVFLLSEAFSFEKAPEQVPSELPKVSETFLICPLMLGPNITGSFGAADGGTDNDLTGPFWRKSNAEGRTSWGWDGGSVFGFDVSRSVGTYGKASTVQPASLQLMPCIKS